MTLLRELIDIPTQVQDGDFVLKLTQGVNNDPQRTVDDYVVTAQLARAFDEALGLVASALADGQSKATFLQGSFGSGKSHFMAMLHLLLSHDVHARSKPELHAAVDKWSAQLDGKRFLLVPVHFLTALSFEQTILGGYVDRIRVLHPEAAVPGVYLGDEIVATELPPMRTRVGEQAFLDALNSVGGDENEWGEYAASWTSEKVDAAWVAPATDANRLELVAAYIKVFRPGTVLEAASTGRGFIDLDRGLAAISVHAASLGYDGVVLFLDELILWLASHIGNLDFVQAESQKLTKLVEATAAGRPVPIISFVARQRDLRELVGDQIAGNEQRSFADNLDLQQGRLGKIELSSGNLPLVAKQRLLKPVDDAAKAALATAVDQALAGRDDVKRQLLGDTGDLDLFRTVYPFSPALVQALIDVSEALQRERTALKVMLQLLVDKRDTLELGQIIPVGDLWDVVAGRDEPFSNELKALFERAKRLWRAKLSPALASLHNVSEATPADAPQRVALANDERLLKTLLLAALVPQVEAFRGLDAARLAALNWGSVASPIPHQETQLVAGKLRRLAGTIGELILGDDPVNPTVSLRLSEVDTDDIVQRAAESFDNQGSRRQKIRALIGKALNDRIGNDLRGTLNHEWRGSTRSVDVVFGNVRDSSEMADNAFEASPHQPKLVIDFPFDDHGRSPEEDLERLDAWSQHHDPTNTVCWLPSFLNADGLATLGRFAAVDELLKHDRFDQYTTHLSVNQKAEAGPLLQNLRVQLAAQLSEAILHAYGVISGNNPLVDPANALTDHYRCLDPAMVIRPTTQPNLEGALGEVCDQIFAYLYPGHPQFDTKVTTPMVRTTWAEIQRALAEPDGRIIVESANRKALRTVANGLQLGMMHESHFQLGDFWRNQLDRHLPSGTDNPATADQVRRWIDVVPGGPRGLDDPVADLVILTVAAQTDRRLMHRGAGYSVDAGRPMPSDVQLVPETFPSSEVWTVAVQRAAVVFGVTLHARVTGPELASMGKQIRDKVAPLVGPAGSLADGLANAYQKWGLAEGARLATARAARDLVSTLSRADDHAVASALADFVAPTSDSAVAKSLATADVVQDSLRRANFDLWQASRPAIEPDATNALTADQINVDFEEAETRIEAAATRVFSERVVGDSGVRLQPAVAAAEGAVGPAVRMVRSPGDVAAVTAELQHAIESAMRSGLELEVSWTARDPGSS